MPLYVTLVHVHVRPEHLEAFIDATRANHEASTREPGNVRFDILRSADDPTRFVFVESYVDQAAAAAHRDTPHYAEWRDTVVDWMVEPRVGVRYDGLYPDVGELDS